MEWNGIPLDFICIVVYLSSILFTKYSLLSIVVYFFFTLKINLLYNFISVF